MNKEYDVVHHAGQLVDKYFRQQAVRLTLPAKPSTPWIDPENYGGNPQDYLSQILKGNLHWEKVVVSDRIKKMRDRAVLMTETVRIGAELGKIVGTEVLKERMAAFLPKHSLRNSKRHE